MVRRFKRRYVAFRITSTSKSYNPLHETLIKAMVASHNVNSEDVGYLKVIDYDTDLGLAVIRCTHRSLHQLLHSIQNVTEPEFETLGISGSIKALKRKFLSKEY